MPKTKKTAEPEPEAFVIDEDEVDEILDKLRDLYYTKMTPFKVEAQIKAIVEGGERPTSGPGMYILHYLSKSGRFVS